MSTWTATHNGLVAACTNCGQKNRLAVARVGARGQCAKCHVPLPPVDEPIEVPSAAVFDALVRAARVPVIVDVWAPWCGPCRMVAPEIAKVARAHAGRWLVTKLNSDTVPEIGERFVVRSIPTLMLFVDGALKHRMSGAVPQEGIEEFVAAGLASR